METIRNGLRASSFLVVLPLALMAQSPVFTTHPASVNVGRGTPARLTAACSGPSLSYQWEKDGSPLAGATTNLLVITNMQPADAGVYRLVATNLSGRNVSSNATLVAGPIAIWGSGYSQVAAALPLALTNATALSAGNGFMAALTPEGEIMTWGNTNGSAVPPNTVARAIFSGGSWSAGVRTNGTVFAWGSNPPPPPATLTNPIMIAPNTPHALALEENGMVTAWGSGLGVNLPAGLRNVSWISTFSGRNYAVLNNGTMAYWGTGGSVPQFLLSVTNAIAVSCGYNHTLVLNADGSVLTDGRALNTVPPGLSNVVAISAGEDLSVALHEDGKVVAWGVSTGGGAIVAPTLTNVCAVIAGSRGGAALLNDGRPFVTLQPMGGCFHAGETFSLRVRAAGSGQLAYQWYYEDQSVAGATTRDWVCHAASLTNAGAYQVTVGNEIGTVTSLVARVVGLPPRNVVVWGGDSSILNVPFGLTNVVEVAARSNHVVTLNSAGVVAQWGTNFANSTNGLAILTGARAVAAGRFHSVALRTNGTVAAWGSSPALTTVPPHVTNIIAVAAGDLHTLALNADGKVFAWPEVVAGRSVVPTNLTDVVAIAAGNDFSLALRQDGSLVGWAERAGASLPPPPGVSHVTAIAAGGRNALALLDSGEVVAWGDNTFGKTNVPAAASNVVAIAAGLNHSMALREDGALVAWGAPGEALNVPAGVSNVISMACGFTNGIVALGGGEPKLWSEPGDRAFTAGQSLTMAAMVSGSTPMSYQWFFNGVPLAGANGRVFTIPAPRAGASGGYQFIASNALGSVTSRVAQATVVPWRSVAAWGLNGSGQTDVPENLSGVVKVSAGERHSLALKEDGTVVAWGDNGSGQCEVPPGCSNIVDAAAGAEFSVAARSDGKIYVWGNTEPAYGQGLYLVPNAALDARAVAAGWGHAASLRKDGTVYCWGFPPVPPYMSPMYPPPGLSGVSAVAAGREHCVALRSNGTVVCWGKPPVNYPGLLTPPENLSNVVAIAAGTYHTLALQAGGAVVGWGFNQEPAQIPADLTNAVAIAAGDLWSMAFTADGRIVTWGQAGLDPETLMERPPPAGLANVVALAASYGHVLAITTEPAPCVTQHPRSQSVPPGWPVSLATTATGQGQLAYQWRLDDADLAGATGRSLDIAHVSAADYGEYQVVVTNLFGNATSRVALVARGNTLAWGDNAFEECCVPAAASNLVSLSAGARHAAGLREDGSVVAWGRLLPIHAPELASLHDAASVVAGGDGGMAIRSNGTIAVWSRYDATRSAPALSGVVATEVDDAGMSVAVLDTGRVAAWGTDPSRTNPPSSFTHIAKAQTGAFGDGLLGLRYDGTLANWGAWQPPDSSLRDIVQVTKFRNLGNTPGYALLADGTVRRLNDGWLVPGLSNVVAVTQGLALTADGTVRAFEGFAIPGPLSNVVEISSGLRFHLVRFGDGSPCLTAQPFDRAIAAGSNFVLTAFAAGAQPMAFQWEFNGVSIAGATNVSLLVNHPVFATSGGYRCLITNALGSVTSRVAQVSVYFPPPSLTVLGVPSLWETAGLGLEIGNLSGQGPVVVYGSSNLVDWVPLRTNPPGATAFEWRDTDWTNHPRLFYRASEER